LHRWFAGRTNPLSRNSANRTAFDALARLLRFGNGRELAAFLLDDEDRSIPVLSDEARELVAAVSVHGAEIVRIVAPATPAAIREAAEAGEVFERQAAGVGHVLYHSHLGLVAELASISLRSMSIADVAVKFSTSQAVIQRVARSTPLLSVSGTAIALVPLRFELVIFDWSSTLADEVELDEAICEEFAARVGVKPFRTLLNQLEADRDYRWFDYFYLAEACKLRRSDVIEFHHRHRTRIRWAPGAKELMERLRRRKVALATNCARDVLALRFDMLSVHAKMFNVIVTSSETHEISSKEKAYRSILEQMGIAASNAVVVSDDYHRDVAAALHVGCSAIWFLRKSEPQFYGSPSPPVLVADALRRRLLSAQSLPTAVSVDHRETAALLGFL
jgi:FMN phosphatase YigB (HAD superfamily)